MVRFLDKSQIWFLDSLSIILKYKELKKHFQLPF